MFLHNISLFIAKKNKNEKIICAICAVIYQYSLNLCKKNRKNFSSIDGLTLDQYEIKDSFDEKNFLQTFLRFFDSKKMKIAVAVSGGVDSMALLLGLIQLRNEYWQNLEIICLTVDHKLRDDSEKNANFVIDFCKKNYVKCELLHWQHDEIESQIQESARNARYHLMVQFCLRSRINVLFLAHHLDDQIETFFMRLKRKSGLYGLSCMSKISSIYSVHHEADGVTMSVKKNSIKEIKEFFFLRPFLNLNKSDLSAFLLNSKVNWYQDSSNENLKYERVRVRLAINSAAFSENLRYRVLNILNKLSIRRNRVKNIADIILGDVGIIDFDYISHVFSMLFKKNTYLFPIVALDIALVRTFLKNQVYSASILRILIDKIYYFLNAIVDFRYVFLDSIDSTIIRKLVDFILDESIIASKFVCKNLIWIKDGGFVFVMVVKNDTELIKNSLYESLLHFKNVYLKSDFNLKNDIVNHAFCSLISFENFLNHSNVINDFPKNSQKLYNNICQFIDNYIDDCTNYNTLNKIDSQAIYGRIISDFALTKNTLKKFILLYILMSKVLSKFCSKNVANYIQKRVFNDNISVFF